MKSLTRTSAIILTLFIGSRALPIKADVLVATPQSQLQTATTDPQKSALFFQIAQTEKAQHNYPAARDSLTKITALTDITPATRATAQLQPGSLMELRANPRIVYWLVNAKVRTVEDKGYYLATIQITHVYVGPLNLLNSTLQTVAPRGQEFSTGKRYIRLKVGEEGIFPVGSSNDGPLSVEFDEYGGFPIISSNANYEIAKVRASLIEQVFLSSGDKQIELLKEYVASSDLQLSIWAIRELGYNRTRSATGLLKSTLKVSSQIIQQIALDESLVYIEGADWVHSKERDTILHQWVSAGHSESDAYSIATMLGNSIRNHEISLEQFLQLVTTGVSNAEWSLASQRFLIYNVAHIPPAIMSEQKTFAFLLDLLKTIKDKSCQLLVASSFGDILLSPDQITEIRGFEKLNENPILQSALERSISNSTELAKPHPDEIGPKVGQETGGFGSLFE